MKKNIILYIFLSTNIVCCNVNYKEENKFTVESGGNCNQLGVSIEIWHQTGNQNLIGQYTETIENKYLQDINGWDKDNYPYPKKFDVKINVQNNLLAYEQEAPRNINDYILNISLKLKVGQSPNGLYPLNSKVCEDIEIVKDRIITNKDFVNEATEITIWKKNIPFDFFYKKYEKQELFINQLVFEIQLRDKGKNYLCNYEYVLPMAERGEP